MPLNREKALSGPTSQRRDVRKTLQDARRHAIRDRIFLRDLERFLRPGRTLEIGAATGQLSAILREHGHDAVASDIAPKYLDVMAGRGLKGLIVDATRDIVTQTGERYANILAQGVIPLIRRDRDTVLVTLRAIHDALEAKGRLFCISPYAWRQPDPKAYFSPQEQMQLARDCGLFEEVTAFPHQVVPPGWYRPWNASLLNFFDHKLAWIRSVRWVWVMEKRSGGLT